MRGLGGPAGLPAALHRASTRSLPPAAGRVPGIQGQSEGPLPFRSRAACLTLRLLITDSS